MDIHNTNSNTDLLKVDGIFKDGFGFISKLVMLDKRLTRDAKAIYSYFCSYAGSGDTAFPSVSKICSDLQFGDPETFKKHRELLENYNYITVETQRESGRFSNNIYTLIMLPNALDEALIDNEEQANKGDIKSNKFKDRLKVQGIYSKGYGLISKLVMKDKKLTRDAKAIYSYFCSYAGNGDTAFPSVSKICSDLNIGCYKTYRKHLKLLIKYGYITVFQEKSKEGKFEHNVYTIVFNPVEANLDCEIKSAEDNKSNNDNSNIKTKKPTTEEPNDSKTENALEDDVLINNIYEDLREFKCKHHTYKISDTSIKRIINNYNDLELLLRVIEYIRENDTEEGYRNIIGVLISAKTWELSNYKSSNNISSYKTKTRFHNFPQRSSNYTEEQLEDIARKKREEYLKK